MMIVEQSRGGTVGCDLELHGVKCCTRVAYLWCWKHSDESQHVRVVLSIASSKKTDTGEAGDTAIELEKRRDRGEEHPTNILLRRRHGTLMGQLGQSAGFGWRA